MTIIEGVVYKKSMIFEVFREYICEFFIFLRENFLVARSYRVLVIDVKSVIMEALVTLSL